MKPLPLHLLAIIVVSTLLCVGVGSGLGAASSVFFVVGLLPLLVGLAAGVGATVTALALGTGLGRTALAGACFGVLAGWFAFQWWDDHHFQSFFAQDLASAREVATGMPPDSGLGEASVAFFAPDAAEELAKQVREATGRDDALGRWLLRAGAGVRLLGPWETSRGLPVGVGGSIAWSVLECLLAALLARAVLTRANARLSAAETNDLDDDPDHQQGSA